MNYVKGTFTFDRLSLVCIMYAYILRIFKLNCVYFFCRFMAAAEAKGITRDRLIELMARTGTELAIQLLGGSRRLNPSNSHQVPQCVVLCGPGRTGEYGNIWQFHEIYSLSKTTFFREITHLLQNKIMQIVISLLFKKDMFFTRANYIYAFYFIQKFVKLSGFFTIFSRYDHGKAFVYPRH